MLEHSPSLEVESVDAPEEIVLSAENITKIFPGTVALDDVSFKVRKGKVNVLIGENGAGKSTLMKILAGVERPTSGKILLDEQEIHLHSPLDATRLGIGIIYQELNLCANLSVTDNIYLARELINKGLINQKSEKQHAQELIQRLEQNIDPSELVGDLRIGQQQIVEIAKALAQEVRILIMDEPTSALSAAEVEVLFRVIRELKSRGVAIIYISHKLEELLQIGDYITVLRDGRKVAEAEASKINVSWLIEKMVGRNPAALFTRAERKLGEVLLKVEDLTLPRAGGGYVLDHVSFELREGEILGFYGLMGAGRSDLVDCLAGARPMATGKLWLNGEPVNSKTVSERIQNGFVLIPEDRQRYGLVQTLSVIDNMLLASLKNYIKGIFLARKQEKEASQRQVKELSIRVASVQQPITSLSGGNQQKVVVAKGLLTHPKVLLLDEPTRGIDVGAKSEIFEIMSRLAAQKYGVIFVSSELKEILAMSDRILVMSKGAITGEFSHQEATEEKLVNASAIGHGPSYKASQQGAG
ncbi:sugar ABC transporter ATP-binding protein [Levilinea saccharolytica]|uniref:Erythritol ABC transporter ATP-binding protein n=1 Tax=Levilinea saccharolytica TaxID=229921 RepID=A0A0M9U2X5_9CHLR|nr:sugar ABC transporter ATP-binding protein [Levilinea saccharolytica]KPL91546.1 sugar ABC transporter ATP-binding protein [Levilinea saccharolytica]GAP19124.1 erythritol ABC transporter ATP-binding protein [Levilinea saccharolytica]